MHTCIALGHRKVSCLSRCPYFRESSFRGSTVLHPSSLFQFWTIERCVCVYVLRGVCVSLIRFYTWCIANINYVKDVYTCCYLKPTYAHLSHFVGNDN